MTIDREPATRSHGYGELLRAHRLYIGLGQRGMAERLGQARRSYQRIENDQDACPAGLLTEVKQMAREFDDAVDKVLSAATEPLRLTVDPDDEWTRLIAGRAAVEAADNDALKPITLLMSDMDYDTERNAS